MWTSTYIRSDKLLWCS